MRLRTHPMLSIATTLLLLQLPQPQREQEPFAVHPVATQHVATSPDDQFVAIVAAGDGLFPRLARLLGREELASDERFATLAARVAHADEINGIVADWCRARDAAEIERLCLAADVPFARTYTVADICADPQVAARGDLATVDDPVIGPVRMQGVYPRMSRTPGSIRSGAPRLGEHNDEVYRGLLGLDDAHLERLRAARAI